MLQVSLLFRAVHRGRLKPTWQGLMDGFLGLRPILRERKKIQCARKVSWMHLANAVTWSPAKRLFRRHDVRPAA